MIPLDLTAYVAVQSAAMILVTASILGTAVLCALLQVRTPRRRP